MDLVPWADVVYGCDAAWWEYRRGLPDFHGLKVCYRKSNLPNCPDVKRIDIPKPAHDGLLFGTVGQVGSGGNSGFQALNLALQWGASRVLLIGFDMTDASGSLHWYGHNNWRGANNPNHSNFKRWLKAFENAARQCRDLGFEVINCSPYSALDCFPKMTLEQATA